VRVLIALEEDLRVGAQAIANAIRRARQRVEVAVAEEEALREEIGRFDPHLVISSLPTTPTDLSGRLSWVFLSSDPEKPSEICVDGDRREVLNPSLGELFCVLEETERVVRLLPYQRGGGC
jgi:hypothetical protein